MIVNDIESQPLREIAPKWKNWDGKAEDTLSRNLNELLQPRAEGKFLNCH